MKAPYDQFAARLARGGPAEISEFIHGLVHEFHVDPLNIIEAAKEAQRSEPHGPNCMCDCCTLTRLRRGEPFDPRQEAQDVAAAVQRALRGGD